MATPNSYLNLATSSSVDLDNKLVAKKRRCSADMVALGVTYNQALYEDNTLGGGNFSSGWSSGRRSLRRSTGESSLRRIILVASERGRRILYTVRQRLEHQGTPYGTKEDPVRPRGEVFDGPD
jgi:hypothetical protein